MTFVSCKLLFLIFCCFKTIHVVLDEIYFEIYSERAFPAVEWGGKREKNFEEEEKKKVLYFNVFTTFQKKGFQAKRVFFIYKNKSPCRARAISLG